MQEGATIEPLIEVARADPDFAVRYQATGSLGKFLVAGDDDRLARMLLDLSEQEPSLFIAETWMAASSAVLDDTIETLSQRAGDLSRDDGGRARAALTHLAIARELGIREKSF